MQDQSLSGDIFLPDDVIDALTSAMREISSRENWIPPGQGALVRLVPRAIRILSAAAHSLPEGVFARKTIRQNTLRIMAYARADIRLGALLELAIHNEVALRDILCGSVDAAYEPYRYNMIIALGIFARHGLVAGVTSPERLDRVSSANEHAAALRKKRIDGGHNG